MCSGWHSLWLSSVNNKKTLQEELSLLLEELVPTVKILVVRIIGTYPPLPQKLTHPSPFYKFFFISTTPLYVMFNSLLTIHLISRQNLGKWSNSRLRDCLLMFVANDKRSLKKNRCILSEVVIGISTR